MQVFFASFFIHENIIFIFPNFEYIFINIYKNTNMGKIIQLDTHLSNQISAWEVVERPISVVKELVENALDAGSDKIKIEIENGGKTLITITDNGEGFSLEDLKISIDKYWNRLVNWTCSAIHDRLQN